MRGNVCYCGHCLICKIIDDNHISREAMEIEIQKQIQVEEEK